MENKDITIQDTQSFRAYLNSNIYPKYIDSIMEGLFSDFNTKPIYYLRGADIFIDRSEISITDDNILFLLNKFTNILYEKHLSEIVNECNIISSKGTKLTKDNLEFILKTYSNMLYHITSTSDFIILHL